MDARVTLTPAAELAARGPVRFPGESPEYRAARTALLAEELELRRHLERVAEQRRALPPGGQVAGDYQFEGEEGVVDFAGLFRDKQTLGVYSYMFGPQRERPCPMCTALLGPLDANAADLDQRMSLAVVARSPLDKLLAFKKERGWRNLRLYTDLNGNYSRDYFGLLPSGDEPDPGEQMQAQPPAWSRLEARAFSGLVIPDGRWIGPTTHRDVLVLRQAQDEDEFCSRSVEILILSLSKDEDFFPPSFERIPYLYFKLGYQSPPRPSGVMSRKFHSGTRSGAPRGSWPGSALSPVISPDQKWRIVPSRRLNTL